MLHRLRQIYDVAFTAAGFLWGLCILLTILPASGAFVTGTIIAWLAEFVGIFVVVGVMELRAREPGARQPGDRIVLLVPLAFAGLSVAVAAVVGGHWIVPVIVALTFIRQAWHASDPAAGHGVLYAALVTIFSALLGALTTAAVYLVAVAVSLVGGLNPDGSLWLHVPPGEQFPILPAFYGTMIGIAWWTLWLLILFAPPGGRRRGRADTAEAAAAPEGQPT